jgi:hypothetical protein
VSRRAARHAAVVAGALALGLLGGCDTPLSTPVTGACTEIGAQCQRPDGPLGVCQAVPCSADASAPCFLCTAQH